MNIARTPVRIDAAIRFTKAKTRGERGIRLAGFGDIEDNVSVCPQLTSRRFDTIHYRDTAAQTVLLWVNEGVQPPTNDRFPVTPVPRRSSLGD